MLEFLANWALPFGTVAVFALLIWLVVYGLEH